MNEVVEVVGSILIASAVASVGLFVLFYIFGTTPPFPNLFWGVFSIHAVVAIGKWVIENGE